MTQDNQDFKNMKTLDTTTGFIGPNYTQIPNEVFDDWLPQLQETELKVLLAILRKTFGFMQTHEGASLTELEKFTGCTQKCILKSIELLIEKELIEKEVGSEIYTLILET